MPVAFALVSSQVPDLAFVPPDAAAIQSDGKVSSASTLPLSAVAQVAGSVGGYESLADADEPPASAGADAAPSSPRDDSGASPFDAARSGSESDGDGDDDGGGGGGAAA